MIRYESDIEMAATIPLDTYVLSLTLSGSCAFQTSGGDMQIAHAGDMIIVNPGEQFSIRTEENFSNLAFQFCKRSLDRTLTSEMGGPLPGDLVFGSGLVDIPSRRRSMLFCCAELDEDGLDNRWSAVGSSFARTIQALLLDGGQHNLKSWMRQESQHYALPYYVRRAEEFMRAHAHEGLTLHAIAEAASVSVRSLHNGFRRFHGQTPMGYLKMTRLERAHQELSACKDRSRTVTQIAYDHGFNQVSKFSSDYRSRFGELPSATLRR